MRNAAIIGTTVFYLLLSTGSFVCAVHCTAGYLLNRAPIVHSEAGTDSKDACHKQKDGKEDKDCPCCEDHGTYVVNENIIVNFDINVSPLSKPVHPAGYEEVAVYYRIVSPLFKIGHESHGPPWLSGKDLSVKFHSLLI